MELQSFIDRLKAAIGGDSIDIKTFMHLNYMCKLPKAFATELTIYEMTPDPVWDNHIRPALINRSIVLADQARHQSKAGPRPVNLTSVDHPFFQDLSLHVCKDHNSAKCYVMNGVECQHCKELTPPQKYQHPPNSKYCSLNNTNKVALVSKVDKSPVPVTNPVNVIEPDYYEAAMDSGAYHKICKVVVLVLEILSVKPLAILEHLDGLLSLHKTLGDQVRAELC